MPPLFTPEEKMYLFSRLPALELSYEPKLHKKVYASLYYIIPKGAKALVWYTYWKEQNVCLLIILNERGNYSDIRILPSVFSNQLALGTILYGTYFCLKQQHYFTCEKIYYYKGLALNKIKEEEKLKHLLELFQNYTEQKAYTKDFLIVGMPILCETYEEALAQLDTLPYRTYGVGIYTKYMEKQLPLAKQLPLTLALPTLVQTNKAIFKVKADLAADIYHLYPNAIDPNAIDPSAIALVAMIPTYKCSVMMNSLFRNIKENTNLDLLEESDDEEEFENANADKFVDLEKTLLMECIYLKKFQKWQPVKVIK